MKTITLKKILLYISLILLPFISYAETFKHNEIKFNDCLFLKDGKMLSATDSGLLLYDQKFSLLKSWNLSNGLPSTRVHCLYNYRGNILVGTENGLSVLRNVRGKAYIKNILTGVFVRTLTKFKGKAVIGTWGSGIIVYDKYFKNIFRDKNKERLRITSFAEVKGILYAGTAGNGIYRFEKSSLFPVFNENLPSPVIFSLSEYKGELWAGTLGGVIKSNGETIYKINNSDVRTFRKIKGELFAGSYSRGLLKFKNSEPEYINPGKPPLNINSVVSSKGKLFICSDKGFWIKENENVRRLNLKGPFSRNVSALVTDNGKRIWIGTFENGLYFLEDNQIIKSDIKCDKRVNALLFNRKDSSLWIGTDNGIFVYRNKKLTKYSTYDGIPSNTAHCFTTTKSGNVIAGLGRRAAVFGKYGIRVFGEKEGLPNRSVTSVMADNEGNIWFGTTIGLYRLSPDNEMKSFSVAGGYTRNGWITSVKQYGNRIFAGTYNSGISVISLNKARVEHIGGGFINPEGIFFHGNYLYAATMDGLKRVKQWGHKKWRKLDNASLSDDVTSVIFKDRYLYIGSRCGLNRIILNEK